MANPTAPADEVMPHRIRPMLAIAGDLPEDDAGWAYEFKWDGVRAIVYLDGTRVRAFTRNDRDLMVSFPELSEIRPSLGARSAVLDGEIVAFDHETRRPNFGRLQQRLHVSSRATISARAREAPASYLVFDLLYLEGRSLLTLPYDQLRAMLVALELSGPSFATPPSFSSSTGAEVLEASQRHGLEGIVAKRRSSPYREGSRGGDWVKIKNFRTQEVVIGGWTDGKGERAASLGALLLGVGEPGGLRYVGKVGTGFSDRERRELLALLQGLAAGSTPFREGPVSTGGASVHFVRPQLVGEVRFGEWTKDGHLRHPSWRGLRLDKEAKDVTREP